MSPHLFNISRDSDSTASLDNPSGEEFFPNIQPKPSLVQLKTIFSWQYARLHMFEVQIPSMVISCHPTGANT